MSHFKFIYKRIELSDLNLKNEKLSVSNNHKIYYIKNKRKIYVYDIKSNYNFLSFEITEESNNMCNLFVSFDYNKFKEYTDKIYSFKNKEIFKNIYDEIINNYSSHAIINLYENVFNINQNDIFDWIKEREVNNDIYQVLPKFHFKINDIIIDTKKGQFVKNNKNNYTTIKFNGGILLDNNDHSWIDALSKIISNNTLIICAEAMIKTWYMNLIVNGVRKKIIIINEKISYDTILLTDYIIIVSIESINTNKNNYIENIEWNRLIIDHNCYQKIINNVHFYNFIMNMNFKTVWININDMPNKEELNILLNIISGSYIHFPLYRNNDIVLIKDLLRYVQNKTECIFIKIYSNNVILHLFNYLKDKYGTNYDKINLCINDLVRNSKQNKTISYDTYCTICQMIIEKDKDILMTHCKHTFCIICLFKNLIYTDKCPICRCSIILKNLRYLNKINDIKIKKIVEIIDNNSNNNDKVLIYIQGKQHQKYVRRTLCKINKKNKDIIYCEINDYNTTRIISNIRIIIFYDVNEHYLNINNSDRSKYYGFDYLEKKMI